MIPIILVIAAFVITVIAEAWGKKFLKNISHLLCIVSGVLFTQAYKYIIGPGHIGFGLLVGGMLIMFGFAVGAMIRAYILKD